MRRTSLLTAVVALPLAGCRAPTIPPQTSAAEYAVYNAWLEQTSSASAQPVTLEVDAQTLALNQNELQFQQCLPRRMQGLLTTAPAATLTASSGNDWLNLGNGHPAILRSPGAPPVFSRPTEWVRLSRVAFTLSGYDAYLWVEHRTCGTSTHACGDGYGTLIHGKKSSGIWTFEDTVCQVMMPADTGHL